jgi:hypothetical protein
MTVEVMDNILFVQELLESWVREYRKNDTTYGRDSSKRTLAW